MKSEIYDIDAVIFDMDGLLLDSERISLVTFVAACREHHYDPDLNVYYRCVGTNFPRTREILLEGYGNAFPLESICTTWRAIYTQETTQKAVPIKEGVVELLKYLQTKKLPRAVVTSSRLQNANLKLTNAGILEYFKFIIGGDQITRGKPDPEIYLSACLKLNLQPARCLALEDSDNGVRSASSAGLKVVQVPDILPPCDEIKGLGHPIVQSLTEVQSLLEKGCGFKN